MCGEAAMGGWEAARRVGVSCLHGAHAQVEQGAADAARRQAGRHAGERRAEVAEVGAHQVHGGAGSRSGAHAVALGRGGAPIVAGNAAVAAWQRMWQRTMSERRETQRGGAGLQERRLEHAQKGRTARLCASGSWSMPMNVCTSYQREGKILGQLSS